MSVNGLLTLVQPQIVLQFSWNTPYFTSITTLPVLINPLFKSILDLCETTSQFKAYCRTFLLYGRHVHFDVSARTNAQTNAPKHTKVVLQSKCAQKMISQKYAITHTHRPIHTRAQTHTQRPPAQASKASYETPSPTTFDAQSCWHVLSGMPKLLLPASIPPQAVSRSWAVIRLYHCVEWLCWSERGWVWAMW